MNKYLKFILKFLLYLIGFIILLVVTLLIVIQTAGFQRFAKNKAVAFLEEKIGTKVRIDRLSIGFPKDVILEGVYFEDQSRDTLLAGDTLRVDISMFKLLSNTVELNEIDLRGITANIQRTLPDSAFNFDYIIAAFASKEPKVTPEDTSGGMQFSIRKVNLDRIKITYKDDVTGNDVNLYLKHFDTKVKEFDLEKMKFRAPDIALNGLNVKVRQTKELSEEAQEVDTIDLKPVIYPDIQFDEIVLQNINADYVNTVNGTDAKVTLGKLLVQSNDLNIRDQKIDLKKIELAGIKAVLALDDSGKEVVEAASVEVEQEVESKGWQAKVGEIVIDNINFKMDDLTQAKLVSGLDFNHLDIKALKGTINSFEYDPKKIAGKVDKLSFRESAGLNIHNLTTTFLYGQQEAYLKNLLLQANATVIRDAISIKYPSIDALKTDLGQLSLNANFNRSRIALHDILLFAPQLKDQDVFKKYPNGVLLLHSNMYGKVNDLTIPNLEISGIGSTKLSASARITGLPDINKTRFEFNFREITSTAADLKNLLPAGTLPSSIQLPDKFTMRGSFDGLTNNFKAKVKLFTSFGDADIDAKFDARGGKGKEKYDAKIKTYAFDVGKLLKKPEQFGKATVEGFIKGVGTDPKTANAVFDFKVTNAVYNDYAYRGVRLKGQAQNGHIEAILNSSDPNARLRGNAIANVTGKYPSVKLDLTVDSIDLQKLHFSAEELRFHGHLTADLATADPDYLNGDIVLAQSIIVSKGKRYLIDSMTVTAVSTADSNKIAVRTEFMAVDIIGKYELTKIGGAVMATVDKYFDIPNSGPLVKPAKPQYFDLNASITRTPLIEQLLPDLKEMETVTIKGQYDSRKDLLVLTASSPFILYKENNLTGLNLDINTLKDSLQYAIKLAQFQTASLLVNDASVDGYANDDKLYLNVAANENNLNQNIKLSGMLQTLAESFKFVLLDEGLTLNGDQWKVDETNALYFGKSGIKAENFVLNNSGQSLSVDSEGNFNSPLNIGFKDFSIETITNIVSKDTLLVGGLINGTAKISDLASTPHFTADMIVGDFNFKGDTLGNIDMKVNNEELNTLAANVVVSGKGNDLTLKGFYYTKSESPFDFELDIDNIYLANVEGYAMGMIKESSGSMRGKLKITGSAADPNIRGRLKFDKAKLNYAPFNSLFSLEDETIRFREDGISLNGFTVRDSAGNRMVLDGKALTSDYRNYIFALQMQAQNFMVLNSTKENNDLYFGKLLIDANVRISGTNTSPVVNGNLRVNEKSNVSFVIPQKDPRIVEREGVIEFVDMDAPLLSQILTGEKVEIENTGIEGMDVAMNIIVDKESIFNIIIDEGNGDFLRIRGEAELTGGIDPSGKVTLAGVYEIEEGKYNITFNFLKREFLIQKGSKITWTGAPTEADVDVTAVYIANTAPLDLISDQLSTSSQSIRNTYKQRLPFEINLIMKGQLLTPLITFDILLPTNKNYGVSNDVISTVNTRLVQLRQEPAELNKQVFAVLLLNHFVGDNPFASESGGFDGERFARQSVSKILTEQLNNLAADMIAGVDLNFDINSTEDYSTGEMQNRTDLTVGLSKRLFNERLKVNVGSNFELEGSQNTKQKTTNIAGDISAEYQLTKDGRYLVRAYRKDEYVVVLGQVVETGVGFILTVEYDKIKDIFAKQTEEFKIQEKERKKRKRDNDKLDEEKMRKDIEDKKPSI